jgi:hypothetical protein
VLCICPDSACILAVDGLIYVLQYERSKSLIVVSKLSESRQFRPVIDKNPSNRFAVSFPYRTVVTLTIPFVGLVQIVPTAKRFGFSLRTLRVRSTALILLCRCTRGGEEQEKHKSETSKNEHDSILLLNMNKSEGYGSDR